MLAGLIELCRLDEASGVHVTFATERRSSNSSASAAFCSAPTSSSTGKISGYATFEDFLAALSARKRKTIRRERRDALANGVTASTWLTGSEP